MNFSVTQTTQQIIFIFIWFTKPRKFTIYTKTKWLQLERVWHLWSVRPSYKKRRDLLFILYTYTQECKDEHNQTTEILRDVRGSWTWRLQGSGGWRNGAQCEANFKVVSEAVLQWSWYWCMLRLTIDFWCTESGNNNNNNRRTLSDRGGRGGCFH